MMAWVIGLMEIPEKRRVRSTGYEVRNCWIRFRDDEGGFSETADLVAMYVDCDVLDLLSPPFCQMCGQYMEELDVWTDQDGQTYRYTCSHCGEVVVQTRHKGELPEEE